MTQRLLVSCLTATLLLSTGCSMFSRKAAAKPKDNGSIAADTEENLKKRYIDRRAAELEAQGQTAVAARAQAVEEFRQKYEYTSAAKN